MTIITDTTLVEALSSSSDHNDQYLGMLAHELRNHLNPIRNAVQLLKMQNFTDPILAESCNVIDRQVTHIAQLLDELVNGTHVIQNKARLLTECFDLADIVKDAIANTHFLIDSRNQELIISQTKQALWIEGDRVCLTHVLSGLLNNASRNSGVGGRINLNITSENSEAVIQVRCMGGGICVEMLPDTLYHFTQADEQGGLGSMLTHQLVAKHGGTIREEDYGIEQGTLVTIRLPILVIASPFCEAEPTEKNSNTRKFRILVVDDYVAAAESLSMLLQLEGYEVQIANCGIKALELTRSFQPQVVLLDIGLPDLNGYEVATQIRRLPETKSTLLFALTGYGGPEDFKLRQAAGFKYHFIKPLNFEKLSALLRASKQEFLGSVTDIAPLIGNFPGVIKKQDDQNSTSDKKILNSFCSNHANDVLLIRFAYQKGDIETAVKLVCKFDDYASKTGINVFCDLAIDLKQVLIQRNDSSVTALLTEIDLKLNQLIAEIYGIVIIQDQILTIQQFNEQLFKLLENNDFISDEFLNQFKIQLSQDQQTDFNRLSQHVFDSDYPKAREVFGKLINCSFGNTELASQDQRPLILIVDDERINQALLVKLLAPDFQIKVTGNGSKALEIAQVSPHPDLVILDINMPGMDGYEVCQRFRDNPVTCNAPVIFVTGASDQNSETRGLQLGAMDFIAKPFHPVITLLRVRNLILLKQQEKQLRHLAHYDALTKVPNRILLYDRMKLAIAQAKREQNMLAVCYLDIDGFKQINDALGHQTGDQVLIEITLRIGRILREGDTIARLGGDEFVVLLPNLHNVEECFVTLKRLHENIAVPIIINHQTCNVTASIGVSIFPDDNEDMDGLLRFADQAMYIAKHSGKNCYHIHNALQK
ncbi:MAG: diguanylate cyclase [Methylobacter sp.]|nr:diguanylate cyclase [Methylobacter sp.]